MFWDLHVPYPSNRQHARQIAAMAIQLGYDGIVWSNTVAGKLTAKDVNNMDLPDMDDVWRAHGTQQSVLRLRKPDYDLPSTSAGSSSVAAAGASAVAASSSSAVATAVSSTPTFGMMSHGFGQKTRLHLLIDDATQLHSLNVGNTALQSYDIVSVATANEKLFHACCSHESVDIVTIEAAGKLPFYLKKPAINLAIERGIHFEFSYAPGIRDASSRRYLFANVLSLLRLTRGRNLLLSSGAASELELRSPWDVITLAVMLGVDAAVSKATLAAHARAVLIHAQARKTNKCVLREIKPDPPAGAPTPQAVAAQQQRAKPARDDQEGPKQKKGKFQK